jgi:hypothetical protein
MNRLRQWFDRYGDKLLAALMLCLGIPVLLLIAGAKWLVFIYLLKEAADGLF